MKNYIKKTAWNFGFEIKRVPDKKPVLYNVFRTNYSKRVLISYLKEPFINGTDLIHSGKLECFTAAEILNEMGYRVDVIHLSSDFKICFDDYDVIYGQGSVFERSFYCEKKLIRIFYETGCSPFFSAVETAKKIRQFYLETDTLCPTSGRLTNFTEALSIFLADTVIVLGNKFVLNTFTRFDDSAERYMNLNAFYFDVYDIDLSEKDFSAAKNHFLWFGSSGLLHKGLDIAIEIFSKRDDIVLHICGGDTVYEKQFLNYYNPTLQNRANIINHGFVDLSSDMFKRLMDQCAFVIFPSVSEGGSPALLNVMANGGLIPIISKSSGLDVGEFGWMSDDCKYESFNSVVNEAAKLNLTDLRIRSEKSKLEIRNNYSFERYKENLKRILTASLQ